jgi:hypothetical protein
MLYLSVHDLTWMNSLVAGADVRFDYERVEAAVAAQYGYGDSTDVLGQASDLVEAIAAGAPFERGNAATALLALAVFLDGNGHGVQIGPRAGEALLSVKGGRADGTAVVESVVCGVPGASLRRAATVSGFDHAVLDRSLVYAMLDDVRAVVPPDDGDVAPAGADFSPYLHRD